MTEGDPAVHAAGALRRSSPTGCSPKYCCSRERGRAGLACRSRPGGSSKERPELAAIGAATRPRARSCRGLAARACSRAASPSRTADALRSHEPARCEPQRSGPRGMLGYQRLDLLLIGLVERVEIHQSRLQRPRSGYRGRRRRRSPRSSRPRSCARWCPARRRVRRSCIRSRGLRPPRRRVRAGVAHREPLAGQAAEERTPGGGAVQHRVADDHVLFGPEQRRLRGADRHDSTRQALAGIVIRLAAQREGQPGRKPGGELCPPSRRRRSRSCPRAARARPDGCDLAGQDAADGAVDVADRDRPKLTCSGIQRGSAAAQSSQSSASSSTGTGCASGAGNVERNVRVGRTREVDLARFPVVDRLSVSSRSGRPIMSSNRRTPRGP